jgi:hypothetical protein
MSNLGNWWIHVNIWRVPNSTVYYDRKSASERVYSTIRRLGFDVQWQESTKILSNCNFNKSEDFLSCPSSRPSEMASIVEN